MHASARPYVHSARLGDLSESLFVESLHAPGVEVFLFPRTPDPYETTSPGQGARPRQFVRQRFAVKRWAAVCGRPSASTACSAASRVLTSERYDVIMSIMAQAKRATVYLEPTLHRALRVKAAETDLSVSELVNNAVRAGLAEDAEDLEAFRARAKEPTSSFENLVSDLKRRGKL